MDMKLKDWRKLKRLTRAGFGELIGVNGITVWRWESGRGLPSSDRMQKIWERTDGAVTADDHHRAVAEFKAGKAS